MTRTIFVFSGDEAEVPAPEYRYHRFLYSSQYGMAVCLARRTGAAPREEEEMQKFIAEYIAFERQVGRSS